MRPLSNLFAVYDEHPVRLAELERSLAQGNEFDAWSPSAGWVVGSAPLPGGPEEPIGVRAAGLAFCEGADRVLVACGPDAVASLEPSGLASLPGDFTFLVFGADGETTAVRSCGGLVPVYHFAASGIVALGTRLDYFVRFLPSRPELDPLVNAVWTTSWPLFPDGRSFLNEVSLLGRGCYLRIRRGARSSEQRYWDPRPKPDERLAVDPERPARLRTILMETLERDLDPSGGNLLTLSGGVDSSSLGALAAGTLGVPLAALSFLFEHPATRARDEDYIDALCARFHFDPHRRVLLDNPKRLELLERPTGSCFQVLHPALCMLEEMQAQAPVRVLVGGEYADEVVGTLANLADWASHTTLRGLLLGGPGSWPTGAKGDLLRWAKRRVLHVLRRPELPFPSELPELVRPELRDEYAEWLERRRKTAARDDRPLRQLALRGEHDGFVAMNWEAASALGVRRSLPFFNREVLELAFCCHPSEQLGPGTKKILRAALRDDVPEKNLKRQDKAHGPRPPEATIEWNRELDEQLQPIVRDDWFPAPPARVDQHDGIRLAALTQIARNRRAAHPRRTAQAR